MDSLVAFQEIPDSVFDDVPWKCSIELNNWFNGFSCFDPLANHKGIGTIVSKVNNPCVVQNISSPLRAASCWYQAAVMILFSTPFCLGSAQYSPLRVRSRCVCSYFLEHPKRCASHPTILTNSCTTWLHRSAPFLHPTYELGFPSLASKSDLGSKYIELQSFLLWSLGESLQGLLE